MASIEKIAEYTAALSELLKTTTLKEVRIKDICEQCGTDRQNFYYYFKDKYDLAAWIYKLDHAETMGNKADPFSVEQVAELLERLRSKADVYIKLFDDTSQNSLFSFMLAAEYEIYFQLKKQQKEPLPLCDEEACALSFDLAAFFQAIVAWVRGEYAVSPHEFAEYCYLMASKIIRDCYKTYDSKRYFENKLHR